MTAAELERRYSAEASRLLDVCQCGHDRGEHLAADPHPCTKVVLQGIGKGVRAKTVCGCWVFAEQETE